MVAAGLTLGACGAAIEAIAQVDPQLTAGRIWYKVADEGSAFSFSGTRDVRFGADTRWVTKQVIGEGRCSNAFFGTDPAPGVRKGCQATTTTLSSSPSPSPAPASGAAWIKIASEWQTFSTPAPQTVRFGADIRWIEKVVSGNGACTNSFFGNDPALGVVKSCMVLSNGSEPAHTHTPTPKPTPAEDHAHAGGGGAAAPMTKAGGLVRTFGQWESLAAPGTLMVFNERTTVRLYSQGLSSAERTFEAGQSAVCDLNTFGRLTSWAHECQKLVARITVQEFAPQASGMPYVDPRLGLPRAIGFADRRIKSGAEPKPTRDAAFRLPCSMAARMSFDDPIVYPGQPGRAHHHTFFGNTGIDANTTNPAASGSSTCFGGIASRSGYWIPSIIDTRFGKPIEPVSLMVYYKQGYGGVPISAITAPPAGLRMIVGNMMNGEPTGPAEYSCQRANEGEFYSNRSRSLPTCAVGDTLWMMIHFPQCWNGRDLDSTDHESHMADTTGAGCPRSHPIAFPRISFVVIWPVLPGDDTSKWRLSSDAYSWSKPGGYSMHADYMNGWEPAVMQQIVRECLNAGKECGASLIGSKQEVY